MLYAQMTPPARNNASVKGTRMLASLLILKMPTAWWIVKATTIASATMKEIRSTMITMHEISDRKEVENESYIYVVIKHQNRMSTHINADRMTHTYHKCRPLCVYFQHNRWNLGTSFQKMISLQEAARRSINFIIWAIPRACRGFSAHKVQEYWDCAK